MSFAVLVLHSSSRFFASTSKLSSSYDCDEKSAYELCKMIKHNVDNTSISGIKDDSYYCTMSFGVNTIVPNSSITPEQFLNSADKAMYEAKWTGKNRIVVSKS